ncbi:MAG: hypothetical protein ACLP7J_05695, partial [Streptosporangiaceae bacterium]
GPSPACAEADPGRAPTRGQHPGRHRPGPAVPAGNPAGWRAGPQPGLAVIRAGCRRCRSRSAVPGSICAAVTRGIGPDANRAPAL